MTTEAAQTGQAKWLADIGAAADDLGWGILEVDPKRIRLCALDEPNIEVSAESYYLNGALLRSVLASRRKPVPE